MEEQSEVRVLGIIGSPRKKGNTAVLVDGILKGAEEAGAIIEKVFLSDLTIGPCQACDSCQKTGKCKQNDDMHELEEKMDNSQVWVLGTPIYWWGPSAQLKTFVDRWYCARQVKFRDRRIILAIPLGGGEGIARHTTGMFEDICDYLDMDLFKVLLAPRTHDIGEIQGKQVLEEARKIGKKAVITSFDQI